MTRGHGASDTVLLTAARPGWCCYHPGGGKYPAARDGLDFARSYACTATSIALPVKAIAVETSAIGSGAAGPAAPASQVWDPHLARTRDCYRTTLYGVQRRAESSTVCRAMRLRCLAGWTGAMWEPAKRYSGGSPYEARAPWSGRRTRCHAPTVCRLHQRRHRAKTGATHHSLVLTRATDSAQPDHAVPYTDSNRTGGPGAGNAGHPGILGAVPLPSRVGRRTNERTWRRTASSTS